MTAKVKFNVFGALFAVTMALAVFGTGLPFGKVIDAMKTGFGNTLGGISFIVIVGAAIAVCMERSGGALSLGYAHHEHGGQEKHQSRRSLDRFIPGLTIFCDTGYIILSGIVRTISATSQLPMPLLASHFGHLAVAVHCLVPTHPGALAAATTMNANLGLLVVASIVFAVPGLIAA